MILSVTHTREPEATVLTSDVPVREKLSVTILEQSKRVIQVTLQVPLDAETAAEQPAIEQFAPRDHTLNLRYCVELNLAAERKYLNRRLNEMYRKGDLRTAFTAPTLASVRDDHVRDAFAPIAVQGFSIFRRLFLEPEHFDRSSDRDTPIMRAALRSVLARSLIVVITSPEPLFPWAFLYDDEHFNAFDLQTLDLRRFWGFRHQLQDEVDGVSRRVRIPSPPAVVAAVCPATDMNGDHRSGPLGQISAERITWTHSAMALAETLCTFDADCLYFFGHADHKDPPTPTTSYIKIDGVELTVEYLAQSGAPRFSKPHVLAFLNGCSTEPLNDWDKASVAGFLCFASSYRVACVTSFAGVPIAFASALAQRFWADFLNGRTLGESLRDARRALLAEYNNPLGLLYAVLGRVETRIIQEESTNR